VETLQAELTNLATHLKKLKMSTLDSYRVKTVKELSGEDANLSGADESLRLVSTVYSTCKNCAIYPSV